jgi:hypothetical protein
MPATLAATARGNIGRAITMDSQIAAGMRDELGAAMSYRLRLISHWSGR